VVPISDSDDAKFLKTLTVLYVEDDASAREPAAKFLRRRVGTVITAANGVKGLEAFRTHPVDILVTDILMPEMDGLAMVEEIRKVQEHLPIIVTTAFERTDYLIRAIELSVDKYVLKPIASERLVGALLDCAHRLRSDADLRRTQDDLQLAMRQLEALNANKDKFFSIISHDLRSPLSSFFSLTQILERDPHRLMARPELAKHARESAQYLLTLLDNLLSWALLQQGALTISLEPVDVAALTSGNIALMASVAQEKNIAVKSLIDQPLWVHADSNMLDAVLRNLLSNALKFTRPSGKVEIAATSTSEEVTVTVKDTGIGIPDSSVPKLFRIEVAHGRLGTAKEKGSGLGLILCREFVEKLGGQLWLESVVDQGTTVSFTVTAARPLQDLQEERK
jgi:signal transduction histidine kinase